MKQPGFFTLTLLLGAVWWLLAAGSLDSLVIGVPTVLLAAWAAQRLGVRGGGADISLPGVIGFLPFFIWESIRGGVDVAVRVLAPTLKLAPGLKDYTMTLVDPQARLLFVNTASLLPGTLAADQDGETVRIHALDTCVDIESELSRLERTVARIYAGEG